MPLPNLRHRPSRYITPERRNLLSVKERQRTRDRRAGVRCCRQTTDAAGCGDGGESGDEWGERGGWGVGGEGEEEWVGGERDGRDGRGWRRCVLGSCSSYGIGSVAHGVPVAVTSR